MIDQPRVRRVRLVDAYYLAGIRGRLTDFAVRFLACVREYKRPMAPNVCATGDSKRVPYATDTRQSFA